MNSLANDGIEVGSSFISLSFQIKIVWYNFYKVTMFYRINIISYTYIFHHFSQWPRHQSKGKFWSTFSRTNMSTCKFEIYFAPLLCPVLWPDQGELHIAYCKTFANAKSNTNDMVQFMLNIHIAYWEDSRPLLHIPFSRTTNDISIDYQLWPRSFW